MIVSFSLTMPNVGSWNGKWTGSGKKYYEIRKFPKKAKADWQTSADVVTKLLDGKSSASYIYDFKDGWTACVTMEVVDAKEANKRKKESKGFFGYEWMVNSILKHGKIIS